MATDDGKTALAPTPPVPVETGEVAFEDYFGFDERNQWFFPDGKQYIEFQLMNEGARAQYQKATSRDVRMFRGTGDASFKVDPSEERRVLLENSVVGWYMLRRNEKGEIREVPFPKDIRQKSGEFQQWLEKANPKHVIALEEAIRKANPWMRSDLTVEQIDEQIQELQELREQVVKENEGKDD